MSEEYENRLKKRDRYVNSFMSGDLPLIDIVTELIQTEQSLKEAKEREDQFWECLAESYDIESREECEKIAEVWKPQNALLVALHHIWKREPIVVEKDKQLSEANTLWENAVFNFTTQTGEVDDLKKELEEANTKLEEMREGVDERIIRILERVWKDRIAGGGWPDKETFINTMKELLKKEE